MPKTTNINQWHFYIFIFKCYFLTTLREGTSGYPVGRIPWWHLCCRLMNSSHQHFSAEVSGPQVWEAPHSQHHPITECFNLASEGGEDLLRVLAEKEGLMQRDSRVLTLKTQNISASNATLCFTITMIWIGYLPVPRDNWLSITSAWSKCPQSSSKHIREVKITLIMHQLMDQIILSCVPYFTHFYLCAKLH